MNNPTPFFNPFNYEQYQNIINKLENKIIRLEKELRIIENRLNLIEKKETKTIPEDEPSDMYMI